MSEPLAVRDSLTNAILSVAALSQVPNKAVVTFADSFIEAVGERVRDKPLQEIAINMWQLMRDLDEEEQRLWLTLIKNWYQSAKVLIQHEGLRDATMRCSWARLLHMPSYFVGFGKGISLSLLEAVLGTVRDIGYAGLWIAKMEGCLQADSLQQLADSIGQPEFEDAIGNATEGMCGEIRQDLNQLAGFAAKTASLIDDAAAMAGDLAAHPVEVLTIYNELVPVLNEVFGMMATDALAAYLGKLADEPEKLGEFEGMVAGFVIGFFIPGLEEILLGRLLKLAGTAGKAVVAASDVVPRIALRARVSTGAAKSAAELPNEILKVIEFLTAVLKGKGMRNSPNVTARKLKAVMESQKISAALAKIRRTRLTKYAREVNAKRWGKFAAHKDNIKNAAENNELWKLLAYTGELDGYGLNPKNKKELEHIAHYVKFELAVNFLESAHLIDARWFQYFKNTPEFKKLGWNSEDMMETVLLTSDEHRIPFTRFMEALFASDVGGLDAAKGMKELEAMSAVTKDMLNKIIHVDKLADLNKGRKTPLVPRLTADKLLIVEEAEGVIRYVVIPPGTRNIPPGIPGATKETTGVELLAMHKSIWKDAQSVVKRDEIVAYIDGLIIKASKTGP